jgi:hypothetical protein
MKNLFKIAFIKAMIRYYDRLKKIEEMFPLLHAAYKESISIDDSNHASWFSSIKFISNEIYQVLIEQQNLLIFCVHLVCTCRISGAKVQLFAYNKFGQKINSASHV